MGKFSRLGNELYQGRKSYDFVGHRALWYAISGTLVALAIAGHPDQGPELRHRVHRRHGVPRSATSPRTSPPRRPPTSSATEIGDSSVGGAASPQVTTSGADGIIIQIENVSAAGDRKIRSIIKDVTGANADQISKTEIGASWGQEVAKRALHRRRRSS